MEHIHFVNRVTGLIEVEDVYGGTALRFMYRGRRIRKQLIDILSKNPIFSIYYGWWQKQKWTKKKIAPFINRFKMDANEFLKPVHQFDSFNDFFTRHLKKDSRPIADATAIIPADGRYRFISNLSLSEGYVVKGKKFDLEKLVDDKDLATEYENGTMVMVRLCPTDYHRFHFPCDCIPGPTKTINGFLYSVSPIAVRKNICIFTENKRTLTVLESKEFGKVIYMEIGATNVGSIHQTFIPNIPYKKGDEKGYFSFGGSALILLFQSHTLKLESDLLQNSEDNLEILCHLGQPMGLNINELVAKQPL